MRVYHFIFLVLRMILDYSLPTLRRFVMKVRMIAGVVFLALGLAGAAAAADWATAEGSCFKKGDMQITAGLSPWYFGPFGEFDMAFHDCISGGGSVGINWMFDPFWTETRIPIIFHAAFHPFNLKVLSEKIKVRDKLDPYVGIGTGWTFGWWGGDVSPTNNFIGGFTLRETIGARWFFSPKLSGNVEINTDDIGSTFEIFRVGISYNL
jgi:hypothetical protein